MASFGEQSGFRGEPDTFSIDWLPATGALALRLPSFGDAFAFFSEADRLGSLIYTIFLESRNGFGFFCSVDAAVEPMTSPFDNLLTALDGLNRCE